MATLSDFIQQQFDGAWNAHDRDRVLNLFADDAVVEMVPPPPGAPPLFRGPDQIRQLVDMLIGGFHVESSQFHEEGDRVSWFSTVENDGFRAMGLDSADVTCEAVVHDGKVQAFTPRFTPSTVARMRAAQNKAVAQRFYDEVANGRNYDAIDEICRADFVDHEEFPGLPPGREGVRLFMQGFHASFPDAEWIAEDMLAEGDVVACRVRMTGTHQGPFMDIPATGRPIDVTTIDIIRFEDGQAVEHWGVTDAMAMMQQLGMMPEPEAGFAGDGAAAAAAPDLIATTRAMYDAFNERDYDRAAALVTDDAEIVSTPTGEIQRGPAGMRTMMQGWATAFPDSQIEVTHLAVSGNSAVVEFTGRGTHTGPMETPAGVIPPTGRAVEVAFCDVVEYRDGRAASIRTYFDLMTMMQQLGLLAEGTAS